VHSLIWSSTIKYRTRDANMLWSGWSVLFGDFNFFWLSTEMAT